MQATSHPPSRFLRGDMTLEDPRHKTKGQNVPAYLVDGRDRFDLDLKAVMTY